MTNSKKKRKNTVNKGEKHPRNENKGQWVNQDTHTNSRPIAPCPAMRSASELSLPSQEAIEDADTLTVWTDLNTAYQCPNTRIYVIGIDTDQLVLLMGRMGEHPYITLYL